MRITEILSESAPRTLYHGTLKKFVDDIFDIGLLPQVGKFTRHAYDEYASLGIPLENVVFAADRQGLGKCVSAIIGQMRHRYPQWHMTRGWDDITARDFYDKAALLVLKRAEGRFTRRPEDDDGQHPPQAEPDDYYHRGADLPDFVLTGRKLEAFLRRNNIRLADYGIEGSRMDRAELLRKQAQGLIPPGITVGKPGPRD